MEPHQKPSLKQTDQRDNQIPPTRPPKKREFIAKEFSLNQINTKKNLLTKPGYQTNKESTEMSPISQSRLNRVKPTNTNRSTANWQSISLDKNALLTSARQSVDWKALEKSARPQPGGQSVGYVPSQKITLTSHTGHQLDFKWDVKSPIQQVVLA